MITTQNDSNYLATIVRLSKQIPIEADSLFLWDVNGRNIITNKTYHVGDVCIYLEPGTRISNELLSHLNMWRDSSKNRDTSKKGYFENSGCVKAVKIRKVISEGVLIKIEELFSLFGEFGYDIGNTFDTINGQLVFSKYQPNISTKTIKSENTSKNSKEKKVTFIPRNFRFHYKTPKLLDSLHLFEKGKSYVVTRKLHGTSLVVSNLPFEIKYNWIQKLVCKWFNIIPSRVTHKRVVSSRHVIKSIDYEVTRGGGYYKDNIYDDAANFIVIPEDYTVYAEIVAGYIQKGYDYGAKDFDAKDFDVYVYRVTYKNQELNWDMLVSFCNEYKLTPVPYLETIIWDENSVDYLKDKYLNKMTTDCKVPVPDEGICVLNEQWFKLKSPLFLNNEYEESNLAGIVDDGEL